MDLFATDTNTRLALLRDLPLFSKVPENALATLAKLFHDVSFPTHKIIVKEGDFVDSVLIIVNGYAEVTHYKNDTSCDNCEILAMLRAGEAIGLNDTGFYSTTGARVATVTAITPLCAIKLLLTDFKEFLSAHPDFNADMLTTANDILRRYFIKQVQPFAEISAALTKEIADNITEIDVKQGEVIIKQGEVGHHVYLIRSGKADAVVTRNDGTLSHLDTLQAGMIFGEICLMTQNKSNTSIKALTDCKLFALSAEQFKQLTNQPLDISSSLADIIRHEYKFKQQPNISIHIRENAEKQAIVILKDETRGIYFQTTTEGLFVWNLLNGQRTILDLSVAYFDSFHTMEVDAIGSLLVQLLRTGFIRKE